MARRRRGWKAGAALLALAISACVRGPETANEGRNEAFAIEFEDAEAPAAFRREALGRRDHPGGAQGLWATVPGLRRPERAEVVNLEAGTTVVVALFSGHAPAGEIRLSNAAAEVLGIAAVPARVRITAVRSEPKLVTP